MATRTYDVLASHPGDDLRTSPCAGPSGQPASRLATPIVRTNPPVNGVLSRAVRSELSAHQHERRDRGMSGCPQHPRRQGHAVGLRAPPISRSGSGSGNRVTQAGRGFPVVGRLHVTVQRLPPPPAKEGGAAVRASPSPPWRGEALLHSSVAPVATAAGVNRDRVRGGSEPGVDAARPGSQSLSWSLCRSHPSMATGRGRARAGRVNQARCGAVRHDCAALCHPQQRIDQRSARRRRQSCREPPGRASSNPIH